jgi:hypothetical protein
MVNRVNPSANRVKKNLAAETQRLPADGVSRRSDVTGT